MEKNSATSSAEEIISAPVQAENNNSATLSPALLASVTYEFTKDPSLLEQYFKIREECYREDFGLKDFSGEEEAYDHIGHIVLARIGDKVLGGARILVVQAGSGAKLPLEEDDFMMRDVFPELNLANVSYCEFTRLVITAEYRKGGEVCKRITRAIVEKAMELGCVHQFSIAPLVQARSNRLIGNQLGVLHVIRTDIKVPYKPMYESLNEQKICLSCTYFFPDADAISQNKAVKVKEIA